MSGEEEPRRLGLDVRFDAEPIEGRLYDHGGDGGLDRRFSGWLGLMEAIDAARGVAGVPHEPAQSGSALSSAGSRARRVVPFQREEMS